MGSEQENRMGEEDRHVPLATSSVAERRSGRDHRATRKPDDTDRPSATSGDVPDSAKRRSAERRQTSDLIAWWGEVERRSGKDRRVSQNDKRVDQD